MMCDVRCVLRGVYFGLCDVWCVSCVVVCGVCVVMYALRVV